MSELVAAIDLAVYYDNPLLQTSPERLAPANEVAVFRRGLIADNLGVQFYLPISQVGIQYTIYESGELQHRVNVGSFTGILDVPPEELDSLTYDQSRSRDPRDPTGYTIQSIVTKCVQMRNGHKQFAEIDASAEEIKEAQRIRDAHDQIITRGHLLFDRRIETKLGVLCPEPIYPDKPLLLAGRFYYENETLVFTPLENPSDLEASLAIRRDEYKQWEQKIAEITARHAKPESRAVDTTDSELKNSKDAGSLRKQKRANRKRLRRFIDPHKRK